MVSFIYLQGSIPGKQIFPLELDKSVKILLNSIYEKVIIGDFNIKVENKRMKDLLQEHTFYNMIKQNTCFKGDGDSCINLLIANSKFSFLKINSFETGLSDYHHMIYSILKTKFGKLELKKLIYRSFKQFDSDQHKLDFCNSMNAVRTN